MLDNGYIYLAASRLAGYVSEEDWALVIEIFGFSPRAGDPDVAVHTFASRLHERDSCEDYVNDKAYEQYLQNNPHNETRFFFPLEGDYIDQENWELIAQSATHLLLRGKDVRLPSIDEYHESGIELLDPPRVHVFELCRYLAGSQRKDILATDGEGRVSVHPNMNRIIQLDEWNHPDVAGGELPSNSETFQQLAQVLATGDASLYAPSVPPNNHWQNWPDAGTL